MARQPIEPCRAAEGGILVRDASLLQERDARLGPDEIELAQQPAAVARALQRGGARNDRIEAGDLLESLARQVADLVLAGLEVELAEPLHIGHVRGIAPRGAISHAREA